LEEHCRGTWFTFEFYELKNDKKMVLFFSFLWTNVTFLASI